ncbi:MAG TPA: rhodanese-like domain-containing protein [Candidatus Kapabacteria bacterium]|nr:rhodanese-like domain-containing protein [Candidatus Kapabacteria bacterium]HPO62785.1 rhodanese-like domain-containing protein [Candidatus Kapabacteria bacterium]
MKKLIIEILIILFISILFGFLYNYYSNDPLPLIYKPKEIKTFNDSTFENLLAPLEEDSILTPLNYDVNIDNPAKELDSIAKDIKKPIKDIEKDIPYIDDSHLQQAAPKSKDDTKKEKNELKGNVTYETLKKYLNDPRVVIIDAREPELYHKSKIGNAINIHPYQEQSEYFKALRNVPDGKTIIVYCEGGNCDLSHIVANDLMNLGYENVLLYLGGFEEWEKKYKR